MNHAYRHGLGVRSVRHPNATVHIRYLRASVCPSAPLPFRRRVREWLVVGAGSVVVAVVGYVAVVLAVAVAG